MIDNVIYKLFPTNSSVLPPNPSTVEIPAALFDRLIQVTGHAIEKEKVTTDGKTEPNKHAFAPPGSTRRCREKVTVRYVGFINALTGVKVYEGFEPVDI